jgi:hypothetical protein
MDMAVLDPYLFDEEAPCNRISSDVPSPPVPAIVFVGLGYRKENKNNVV